LFPPLHSSHIVFPFPPFPFVRHPFLRPPLLFRRPAQHETQLARLSGFFFPERHPHTFFLTTPLVPFVRTGSRTTYDRALFCRVNSVVFPHSNPSTPTPYRPSLLLLFPCFQFVPPRALLIVVCPSPFSSKVLPNPSFSSSSFFLFCCFSVAAQSPAVSLVHRSDSPSSPCALPTCPPFPAMTNPFPFHTGNV